MLPQNFLVAAWPLCDLWDLLCQISDHRRKEGSAQKDAKITKIQIGRRLDSAHAEVRNQRSVLVFVLALVHRSPLTVHRSPLLVHR